MKTSSVRKLVGLAGLASLTLLATGVQAGHGYPGHPGHFQGGPDFEYRQHPGPGPRWGDHSGPGPRWGGHAGPGPRWGDMSIEQRQRHLQARVEHGLRSGRLSHYEARELFQDLRRSEFLERRFAADGRLSRAEWSELDHMLDRIQRDLRHELRDDDRRGGRPGWGHGGYAWR